MTSSKQGAADSGGNGGNGKFTGPPQRQSLLPKKIAEPFLTDAASTEVKSIVRLTVEFPLKISASRPNDLALMFKKFTKKLLTVDKTASVLNWDYPDQNPIQDADDIECKENILLPNLTVDFYKKYFIIYPLVIDKTMFV